MAKKYKQIAVDYAKSVVDGEKIAGKEVILACERFLNDLERKDIELREFFPDLAINIMETTLVHQQGEDLDGNPLQGKPFILEPFQVFIVYNLLGFFFKGTDERRYKEAFIMLGRKNGKALSLDTDIPTPNGWKKMVDIHEGDYVFGADGKVAKVLYESEIFNKEMYLVTFEDGEQIKASADHIWTVKSRNSVKALKSGLTGYRQKTTFRADYRENDGWYDTDTKSMLKNFRHFRKDSKSWEYQYRVPMNKAVEYPEADLLIDPYTFGVWLGDGCKNKAHIVCSDLDKEEMMNNVASFGHTVKWYKRKNRTGDFGVDLVEGKATANFITKLRQLGVFNNKHIPDVYMTSSIEQRKLLLQGLMDTDGTVSKRGQCSFTQKDENFIKQVKELCASLGIKANYRRKEVTCNGKECEAFEITFFVDKSNSCFRLKRKHDLLKDELSKRMLAKSIINIEPIPNEPSKCIMVDNETHLYLCGKNYTTTHNTSLIAGLAWAVSILQRNSGSKCYIVANALKQAEEAFHFLTFSIKHKKVDQMFKINDNMREHSISYTFKKNDGTSDGSMEILAMPANPESQDSFNCNFAIADEVATYKRPAQYNRFKEAMKAYTNRLMVGITTAGDNENSFGYRRMDYGIKVVNNEVKDDSLFVFIARADKDENGDVDYTNPIQHEKANPNYNVTIRPKDILNDSLQAQNDPQQRKDFLSRSLNIYSTALKSYFDLEEFRASDNQYNWTLEELSKLPINWYGGADLSRMHDLTATALFGQYKDVDIIITHAFFPLPMASEKAEQDNIPLFGWQDDGWLTMCNSPTVNMGDVVNWFSEMRNKGFKIVQVGHDRKFAGEEYIPLMRQAKFNVVDQPQLFYVKSQGFRHIERSAKNKKLYYLHSEAYEYCVSNVRAVEKTDDAVQYEKVYPTQRIDLFDASVFACIRCIQDQEKQKKIGGWFG